MNYPGVKTTVNDKSNIPQPNSSIAYFAMQGITQIGEIDKPIFISNWQQYLEYFGGLLTDSNFPLYVRRALDAGGKGWIKPVGHYTNIADKTTLAGTKATATLTVSANSAVFTAKAVGAGYNGIVVQTTSPRSGLANKVDLEVRFTTDGRTLTQKLYDVPTVPTTNEKSVLNSKLKWIDIGTVTNLIPVGSVTLASGAKDNTAIIDADYNGNQSQQTGWYGFDELNDIFYIINADRPNPAVDIALANYCIARGDVRFIIRAPIVDDIDEMVDYRMGTGSYSHTPINTWLGTMWAGHFKAENPLNKDEVIEISSIGDVAGKYFDKGRFGEWFSVARKETGRLQNTLGFSYNLGSIALRTKVETAYNKGLNFALNQPGIGETLWGNNSLLQDSASIFQQDGAFILQQDNVADLVLLVIKTLRKLILPETFQPNDPKTWLQIYHNVKPFINLLETNRAIVAGEGENWVWLGDQDLGSIDELGPDSVNNKVDVSNGIYKAIFKFKPISAVRYIELSITPTDAGADITLI